MKQIYEKIYNMSVRKKIPNHRRPVLYNRTDRCRRTYVDEQRELHRLQKFPDLRCRLHPYLEVQGPSDTDDCIGRGCGVDIVLVIMRSPIAWPYALIYRRYRAMQTLEY